MRLTILSDGQMRTPEPTTHGLGRVAFDLARMFRDRGHDVTLVGSQGSACEGVRVVEACPPVLGAVQMTEEAVARAALGTEYDAILDISHSHMAAYKEPRSVIFHQDPTPLKEHPHIHYISKAQREVCGADGDITINRLYKPHIVEGAHRYDVALFLGNIVPHKGAHYAVEVAKRAGVKLWIAGKVLDGAYGQKVLAMCDDDRVTYIGPLDEREKYRTLAQVRLLLSCPNKGYVNYTETAQLAVAEAGLSGTPVVSSRCGGVVEYALPGIGFNGASIGEMAEMVPWALDMGNEDVRTVAEATFLLENHAEEWEGIMEGVA
jgi:glycosyltransferase involved in cell wall biosynthesis